MAQRLEHPANLSLAALDHHDPHGRPAASPADEAGSLVRPGGAMVLWPDREKIRTVIDDLFKAPEGAPEALATTGPAATKMAGLINELLDVSRLEMKQDVDLMLRDVDLVRLVQRAIDEQQPGAQRHQVRLETELPALRARCDPDRVERALQNLLSNAVKYSPAGGEVVVGVAQEEGDGHRWAAMSVTDPGVGIPAADLPRIFDRFARAGNVRGHIAGTGIGLAYVSEIAKRHGGSVTADSKEGHGSTFTLRLPLG